MRHIKKRIKMSKKDVLSSLKSLETVKMSSISICPNCSKKTNKGQIKVFKMFVPQMTVEDGSIISYEVCSDLCLNRKDN